jgi:hypothetical protein
VTGLAGRLAARMRSAATAPAARIAADAMFAVVGAPALETITGPGPAGVQLGGVARSMDRAELARGAAASAG